MKLLICTQAIDQDDPALGFFVRWVEELAKRCEFVTVVCLKKGAYVLPENVHVFSLGKEKGGAGRLSYAARFLRLVWREKGQYDAVLVHMNQEYVLLAGLLWKALGKKVFLWRNHAHGTTLTNIAVALSNAVFCTSPHSYTARFKKTTLMPVGIDAVCAEGDAGERNERSLLVLGRVAPVKRVDRILEAVRLLPQDVAQGLLVNIVGDALPEYADYMASLRAFAEKLDNGVRVVFAPGVSHAQTALLYAAHGVYVNATPPGSFDKTMLEAMVCGATVVATNDAIAGVLGPLAPRGDDAHGLARSIEHALRFSGPERQAHRVAQRAYVADQHSLDALSRRLVQAITKRPESRTSIVVVINRLGYGGAERLVVDEVNELSRRGVRTSLVFVREGSDSYRALCSHINPQVIVRHIPFASLLDVAAWRTLTRFLRKEKPGAVVTHLWFANFVGRIAGAVAGVRTIISFEHNVYDLVKTRKQFVADWVLQYLSTKVVAVSVSVQASLWRHGISPRKTVVIGNGMDLSRYRNGEASMRTPATKKFLFVGRLIPQKAVDVLLKALAKTSGPTLVIVGEGADRKELELLAEDLALGERVVFLGVRDDVPALMESAYALVLPSRWEGQGLVIPEAFASGIPVVVTEFGAARDTVHHGENGLVVPIDDVGELARALQSLHDDTKLRARLALGAAESARGYTIERHVATLLTYVD